MPEATKFSKGDRVRFVSKEQAMLAAEGYFGKNGVPEWDGVFTIEGPAAWRVDGEMTYNIVGELASKESRLVLVPFVVGDLVQSTCQNAGGIVRAVRDDQIQVEWTHSGGYPTKTKDLMSSFYAVDGFRLATPTPTPTSDFTVGQTVYFVDCFDGEHGSGVIQSIKRQRSGEVGAAMTLFGGRFLSESLGDTISREALAPVVPVAKSTPKFSPGDRIRLTSEEGGLEVGDAGVVVRVGTEEDREEWSVIDGEGPLYILRLDGEPNGPGGENAAHENQLELAPPTAKFAVGDRVTVAKYSRGVSPGKFVVTELVPPNDECWSWLDHDGEQLYGLCPEGRPDRDVVNCLPEKYLVASPVVLEERAEPATDGYFAKKFDAGKRDYTLLPADAMSMILDREGEVRREGNFEVCDAGESLRTAVEHLFDYRAGGDANDILDAYVYSCRDSVIESLDGVVAVLEHGAKKYDRDSWATVPDAENRYFSAAMRHARKIAKGERNDSDSGLNHWGHFRTNVLFLVGLHYGYRSGK